MRKTLGELLVTIIVGLGLAAMVHILVLLNALQLSVNSAWQVYAEPIDPFYALPIAARGPEKINQDSLEETLEFVEIPDIDPQFTQAICRYHLREGPVHIVTEDLTGFWSVNIIGQGGVSLYSTNEQAEGGKPINLMIVTPQQYASLTAVNGTALREYTLFQTAMEEGAVLFQLYNKYDKGLPNSAEALQKVFFCSPFLEQS